MPLTAMASVHVMDLSDSGSLDFYLTSNLPYTIIYNAESDTYDPDWSVNNLTITPIITYNGVALPLSSSGLTIAYRKQFGSGTRQVLESGETVTNGVLTVSAKKLLVTGNKQVTYICLVSYTDPDTGSTLSREDSMTFSLISTSKSTKYISISGESAFLYNAERRIVGSNTITLSADYEGVTITNWKYKKADGTFDTFPSTYNASTSGDTLVVKDNEANIWIDGKIAVIKVFTNDQNVYDIAQIVKIYDGVAGTDTVSAVLTNENFTVAMPSSGVLPTLSDCQTRIYIYEGENDVTNLYNITVTASNGVTYSYNSNNFTCSVTAITQNNSYVDFECTRTGYSNVYKRFSITLVPAGQDGRDAYIYEIEPSSNALNLDANNTFTPPSVTFNSVVKMPTSGGAGMTINSYSGRFIVKESTDGTNFTTISTSSVNEDYVQHTPTSTNVKVIRCELYAAGGTTTLLDYQSVIVTKDGEDGQDGADGAAGTDALSMGLGNYSDVIPCDTTGKASMEVNITIPFYAYKGIQRVACTATVGTLPSGVTVRSNSAATTSSNGQIQLTVANNATFGSLSTMSGEITITLTAENKTSDFKYNWAKNVQAEDGADGVNAVLFQLYSDDGGTVEVGRNTTIKTRMYDGTTQVTPTNIKWYQFSSGSYTQIAGQTGTSILITPAMVTDYMLLKCTCSYNSNNYEAYYAIDDISDPIQTVLSSTVTQFKNGEGCGAIYCRLYRSGNEVDPIRTTVFSETAPSVSRTGDFYYHLDTVNKTCTLKKYNGSSWVNATETDEYIYKYYRTNKSGVLLDTSSAYQTQRCIYIDPSIIDFERMVFMVEVEER